jgi:hypothetical protein
MIRRVGLAAVVLAWTVSGCTRENVQPVLPPQAVVIAPPPTPAASKPVRPPPRPWARPSSFAPDPVEAAPRLAARAVARPVAADTLNAHPEGLSSDVLQNALNAVMPRFGVCFEKMEGSSSVALSFEVQPSGRTSNSRISGAAAATPCVADVVSDLKLPSFSGPPVRVQFPLSAHRAPPTQGKTAAAPEAAPPVFVNP